jgi:hypothetical protein
MKNAVSDSSKGVLIAMAREKLRCELIALAEVGIPYAQIETTLRLEPNGGKTVHEIIQHNKWEK